MQRVADEAGASRIIGRASIVAAGTAYRQAVSFVSGLIVARVIGAADYGIFNLARNLVEVTGIFTRLGLDLGLQRFFGETNTAQLRASRIGLLRRVRLLADAVALLPVIALALGLGRVLEANVYPYPHFAEVLLCLALALPFLTDLGVLGGAYRGILRLAPSVIAECILLPTIRLAAIVVLFLAGWRLWGVVAGSTLASFVASAFLAMRARADFRDAAPPRADSWADALRVVRYSMVLAGSMIVTALTTSMDVLMLGYFATAEDLGQYSLAKTLVVLTTVLGVACGQGLEALVAERYFRGDLDGMVRVMSLSARLIALVTVPMFAIFLFWGAQIALLFGPSFAVSPAVVSWLAAGPLIAVMFWPAATGLSMTGRHVLELKILAAGLAIVTLLCWLVVPAFGQLGAAIATCASLAMVHLARVMAVRRYLGAFPFGSDILLIAAIGVGLAWLSDAVLAQSSLPWFWNTVFGIGCFLVSYALAIWAHVLSEAEKLGIRRAVAAAAGILSRKTSDVGKRP